MVIGAGPAGLQAAIAAARGHHRVTIYEQQNQARTAPNLAISFAINWLNVSA